MKHKTDKKNLRRINVVVTAQTDYHLCEMCAQLGYGEKDKGRVIDKLMRNYQANREMKVSKNGQSFFKGDS